MLEIREVSSPSVVGRRVVSLIDPRSRYPDGDWAVGFVAATLQMLKPGERARPQRQSINAMGFVLESIGAAKTIVDGKHCLMAPSDLVLTAACTRHSHVHDGAGPVIWLDMLDVGLYRVLGNESFQAGPIVDQPSQWDDAAFGVTDMVPFVDGEDRGHSPVFRYSCADAVRAWSAAPPGADGMPRVRYAYSSTGGESLATLEPTLIEIEGGAATARVTVAVDTALCVVEGSGRAFMGDTRKGLGEKGVFTVPFNRPLRLGVDPGRPAQLFVVSNAPVFHKLGLYRSSIEASA
jgi:gentisate 1,2-dioxygenase